MKVTLIYIVNAVVYLMMVSGTAHATTIIIGKNQFIKTIKEAISIAKPKDSILVEPGIYAEGNIVIDKPLTLIGLNFPIIDGKMKFEPISIKSPFVNLEGFMIKNSGHSSMNDIAAIKIYNTHHITIKNNKLENNFFGIYLQQANHCSIIQNYIQSVGTAEQLIGNGIHAWKSDQLLIGKNYIQGHRDGIYLEFVTHTEVKNNLSAKNLRYGLHFMFSHDNGYYSNTFRANGAGVAVMYTKRVTMMNNTFEENWGDAAYGLLLKDITDSQIRKNIFLKNTAAIFMEGSNRIDMSENNFTNNGWALKIQASCLDNQIMNNNFINNSFDVASNGTLTLNLFKNNYWDKYEGYDLNKDGHGDIPFRPISLFSMLVERYPTMMLLFRSFMVMLFDRTEKALPSLTPEGLKDEQPRMKSINV